MNTRILAIREAPVRRLSGPSRAYLIGESRLSVKGGLDTRLQVWDLHDPQRVTALAALSGLWGVIEVQPGGAGITDTLHDVSAEPATSLWDLDPAAVHRYLCSTGAATITPQQWQRYLPGLPYRRPCGRS